MSTQSIPAQAGSEETRTDGDESVRINRKVAWYAEGDGELNHTDRLDTPVYVDEVYELVSVMLKHAPFDFSFPTTECVIEVTNQRAWPGFIELVLWIFEYSVLHAEARS